VIRRVTLKHFKRFDDVSFELGEHVVLAGPNNSGKTTLLQAIATWNLALQRWKAERRPGSHAKKKAGVPITRKDFTAIPLREMSLLWTDGATALTKDEGKPGFPKYMEIGLDHQDGSQDWSLTFEFRCQSSEQVYVKPSEPNVGALPPLADSLSVVHVPAFSGIGVEETRYDRPYQDYLVGQGKAGDILRNLLLEVSQRTDGTWDELARQVREVFGYMLRRPEYTGQPFIVCEYAPDRPMSARGGRSPVLDVASAGSGFHQVLLLLGFFYARPSSVLLLDEPDAHLHVILQKQVYDLLRRIAAHRRCQLVIATHSEVLLDNTSASQVYSFYDPPHILVDDVDREKVREALKRLTATEVLLAERSKGVLYLESRTDLDLLAAWSRALDHPVRRWFEDCPFWHSNQGRNPTEARGHFFAIQAVKGKVQGYLLLDGDNRKLSDHEVGANGLVVGRWHRYETESYLIHPTALCRFVEQRFGPLFVPQVKAFLDDQLPPAVLRTPLEQHDYYVSSPVSKTLLPALFRSAGLSLPKEEYYLIAEQMLPDEISGEVREKLDIIARGLGVSA
jgi:predicted ATPase